MKNFKELRTYAVDLFGQLAKLKADNEKAVAKLKSAGIYAPDYLANCEKEATDEVLKLATVLSAKLKDAVKETVNAKRAGIAQMLTTAPTTEQVNLLNTIQFQGTNVTEAEISSLAVRLTGNYQALHSLQTIARKAGITLHIPVQYDFEALTSMLNQTEKYLNERIQALANVPRSLNFRTMDPDSKAFFAVWDDAKLENIPLYGETAVLLDGNTQSAPAPTVEKRTLTAEETAVVEGLFSNRDTATAMTAILNSPELYSLVSLHPQYGKLLTTA